MLRYWPKKGDEYREVGGKKRSGTVILTNPSKSLLELPDGKNLWAWNRHLDDPTKWALQPKETK